MACRHAGRSRVRFSNQEVLLFHQWTKGAAVRTMRLYHDAVARPPELPVDHKHMCYVESLLLQASIKAS